MFRKNIFKDIGEMIFQVDDHLSIRDGHKDAIQAFLNTPTKETAAHIFEFIQDLHQKETVFKLLNDLRLYERGFLEMLPDHRDHYLHSASVYVLGLAVYNSCPNIRDSLCTDRHPRNSRSQKTSFLFRWSLAACLHDMAYPLEIALRSFNKYSIKLHELSDTQKSFIMVDPSIYNRLNLLPILKPNVDIGIDKRDTALGLIVEHLTRKKYNWDSPISYETLLNLLSTFLKENLMSGRIDHGVFSAFILLNRIYYLYKQNQFWDIKDFYFEIIDAATAIFLHNAYLRSNLKDIFGEGRYRFDHPSSLGFLLYLCDSVCEWLRGSESDAKQFGFRVPNENTLIFKVPRKAKTKMDKAIRLIDDRITVEITTTWRY